MALADTFVRQVKHSGKVIGDKYTDGGGMYLLVKASGKYWRMDYTHSTRRRTLALGVYPAVSLAKARKRRDAAREQLADGVDPNAAKRQEKREQADAASNTFEIVARDWLAKTAAKRAPGTQARVLTLLEHDVFPFIGIRPISKIGPREFLEQVVRKIEARGSIDTAHRAKQGVRADISVWRCGWLRRERCHVRSARSDSLHSRIAFCGDYRAQAGGPVDALNIRICGSCHHCCSAQTKSTGLRSPRRAANRGVGRD